MVQLLLVSAAKHFSLTGVGHPGLCDMGPADESGCGANLVSQHPVTLIHIAFASLCQTLLDVLQRPGWVH